MILLETSARALARIKVRLSQPYNRQVAWDLSNIIIIIIIINITVIIKHTRNNKGNQKYCQPVMTNEGPALDSRALAQDLTKVRLSLP